MGLRVAVVLPDDVYSSAEVLGSESAMPSTLRARCFLPVRSYARSKWNIEPLKPPPVCSTGIRHTDWGYVNSDNAVTIRAVAVEFECNDMSVPDAALADTGVTAWATTLFAWLSVLMEGHPSFSQKGPSNVLWPREIDQAIFSEFYNSGDIYEPSGTLSAWEWRHALEHAAKCEKPPSAHSLLARARASAVVGNNRHALLDAASAAEIALIVGLEAELRSRGSDDVTIRALLRRRTLGAFLDLATELDIVDDSRFELREHLGRVRNSVVHQHVIPTDTQTDRAILLATFLVSELNRLPDHCVESADFELRLWSGWTSCDDE
jgi:hypothetical protein